jgi:hypothetical protein
MTMQQLDAARAEAFAGRVLEVVNDGMMALTVSIGHRTGLFDTMADLDPADSLRSPRQPDFTSGTSASGSAPR